MNESELQPQHDPKITVEIWKKIIDVQQHFNDLELRIRNFALALTGAFLALGGYAIKDTSYIVIFGVSFPTSTLIILTAVLPLAAFFFMDKYWYHRLLDGAVKAGIDAEKDLKNLGYKIALGTQISFASPIDNYLYGTLIDSNERLFIPLRRMHSRHKMDVFYGSLAIALIAVATALAFGLQKPPNPPSQIYSKSNPELPNLRQSMMQYYLENGRFPP